MSKDRYPHVGDVFICGFNRHGRYHPWYMVTSEYDPKLKRITQAHRKRRGDTGARGEAMTGPAHGGNPVADPVRAWMRVACEGEDTCDSADAHFPR